MTAEGAAVVFKLLPAYCAGRCYMLVLWVLFELGLHRRRYILDKAVVLHCYER